MKPTFRLSRTRVQGAKLFAALVLAPMAVPFAAAAADETMVIARDTDFNTLDPSRSWSDSSQIYLTAAYEQLVRIGKDDETIEPRIAQTWSVSADGLTHTFNLNLAARFSDGSPVEAKDVAFSLMRLKNLKAGASFLAEGIDSIDTPDAHTVVIHLSAPDPEFVGKVSAPYGAIINSDVAM